MLKLFVAAASVAAASGAAMAVEYQAGNLGVSAFYNVGTAATGPTHRDATAYSNVTNFLGQAITNGISGPDGAGGFITPMVMDDLTPLGVFGGGSVNLVSFSCANLNATSVNCRPRIRFWMANGAGGGPGTYLATPANIGFTFNPITLDPGVTVVTGNVAGSGFLIPGVKFWAGVTFDNGGGATATAGELDNMGQGLFNPPDVGTSADNLFVTAAPGSFFGVNNPAGAQGNLGGDPVANLGWEFIVVPTPGALGLFGIAGIVAARRRRA